MFWCAITIHGGRLIWFAIFQIFGLSHLYFVFCLQNNTPLWSFNFLNYRIRRWPGRQRITERRPRSRPGCEILNSLLSWSKSKLSLRNVWTVLKKFHTYKQFEAQKAKKKKNSREENFSKTTPLGSCIQKHIELRKLYLLKICMSPMH